MALPATIHMYYVEFSFRKKTKLRESSRLETRVECRNEAYRLKWILKEYLLIFKHLLFHNILMKRFPYA